MKKDEFYSLLRCPDCLCEGLVFNDEVYSSFYLSGEIRCNNCKRILRLKNGVLFALPISIASEGGRNQTYYDNMSTEENNLLIKRASTRNNKIKIDKLIETLGLDDTTMSFNVLELGVGEGIHGAKVLELGHNYVGVDISSGLLFQARKRYPLLKETAMFASDAGCLPFQSEIFDRVFCVATLHHLPEPLIGIKEIIRVLRKDGYYCVLEPKRFYPTQLLQYLRNRYTEVSAMKMTVSNVKNWLCKAGIQEINVSYCVFTPNNPKFVKSIWDRIDKFLEYTHFYFLSVMFCIFGKK